jgi:signal peptidase I
MNPDTLTPYTMEELQEELTRVKSRESFLYGLRNTVMGLLVVAAVTAVITIFVVPVLHIYGDSMSPTLNNGDIVLALKSKNFKPGDIIAFHSNNKVLVKRVIAESGDAVSIDSSGTVSVNDTVLEEPYVSAVSFGQCDLAFPYQVPEHSLFVMGDHREVSIDSRTTEIGCVPDDQIIGKIVFRIWPLNAVNKVH